MIEYKHADVHLSARGVKASMVIYPWPVLSAETLHACSCST